MAESQCYYYNFVVNLEIRSVSLLCFFFYFIYSFIFDCAGSSLLPVLFSSSGEWRLLSLQSTGSRAHRLGNCGAGA